MRALRSKADSNLGAVGGRGLYGVSVEVDQHLGQLNGVGLHVQGLLGCLQLDVGVVRAQPVAHEVDGLLVQFPQVDVLQFEGA